MEQTVKCRLCGEPYTVYSMMAGDQSACPQCRRKAKENMEKPESRPFTIGKAYIKRIDDDTERENKLNNQLGDTFKAVKELEDGS